METPDTGYADAGSVIQVVTIENGRGPAPARIWPLAQTVRSPWCLSCCEGLDRDRYDVIQFDS